MKAAKINQEEARINAQIAAERHRFLADKRAEAERQLTEAMKQRYQIIAEGTHSVLKTFDALSPKNMSENLLEKVLAIVPVFNKDMVDLVELAMEIDRFKRGGMGSFHQADAQKAENDAMDGVETVSKYYPPRQNYSYQDGDKEVKKIFLEARELMIDQVGSSEDKVR